MALSLKQIKDSEKIMIDNNIYYDSKYCHFMFLIYSFLLKKLLINDQIKKYVLYKDKSF